MGIASRSTLAPASTRCLCMRAFLHGQHGHVVRTLPDLCRGIVFLGAVAGDVLKKILASCILVAFDDDSLGTCSGWAFGAGGLLVGPTHVFGRDITTLRGFAQTSEGDWKEVVRAVEDRLVISHMPSAEGNFTDFSFVPVGRSRESMFNKRSLAVSDWDFSGCEEFLRIEGVVDLEPLLAPDGFDAFVVLPDKQRAVRVKAKLLATDTTSEVVEMTKEQFEVFEGYCKSDEALRLEAKAVGTFEPGCSGAPVVLVWERNCYIVAFVTWGSSSGNIGFAARLKKVFGLGTSALSAIEGAARWVQTHDPPKTDWSSQIKAELSSVHEFAVRGGETGLFPSRVLDKKLFAEGYGLVRFPDLLHAALMVKDGWYDTSKPVSTACDVISYGRGAQANYDVLVRYKRFRKARKPDDDAPCDDFDRITKHDYLVVHIHILPLGGAPFSAESLEAITKAKDDQLHCVQMSFRHEFLSGDHGGSSKRDPSHGGMDEDSRDVIKHLKFAREPTKSLYESVAKLSATRLGNPTGLSSSEPDEMLASFQTLAEKAIKHAKDQLRGRAQLELVCPLVGVLREAGLLSRSSGVRFAGLAFTIAVAAALWFGQPDWQQSLTL